MLIGDTQHTLYSLLSDLPFSYLERWCSGMWDRTGKKYNKNEFLDFYAKLLKTRPEYSDYYLLFKDEEQWREDGTTETIPVVTLVSRQETEKVCRWAKTFRRLENIIYQDVSSKIWDALEAPEISPNFLERLNPRIKLDEKKLSTIPLPVILGSTVVTREFESINGLRFSELTFLIEPAIIEIARLEYAKEAEKTILPEGVSEQEELHRQLTNYKESYRGYRELMGLLFRQKYEEKMRKANSFDEFVWK